MHGTDIVTEVDYYELLMVNSQAWPDPCMGWRVKENAYCILNNQTCVLLHKFCSTGSDFLKITALNFRCSIIILMKHKISIEV
jgi:hypothetical protein